MPGQRYSYDQWYGGWGYRWVGYLGWGVPGYGVYRAWVYPDMASLGHICPSICLVSGIRRRGTLCRASKLALGPACRADLALLAVIRGVMMKQQAHAKSVIFIKNGQKVTLFS